MAIKFESNAERAIYREIVDALGIKSGHEQAHLLNSIRYVLNNNLTDKQGRYLEMFLSGYSMQEVAKELGVVPHGVSQMIRRALLEVYKGIVCSTPSTLSNPYKVEETLALLSRMYSNWNATLR